MKKITALLTAGLFVATSFAAAQKGETDVSETSSTSAKAAQQTTKVTTPLNVTVSNVCTYNVPDMSNVNGQNYKQTAINMTYNALAESTSKTENYVFRCTKGTSFNALKPVVTGNDTLAIGASNSDATTASTGDTGDIHTGTLTVTIAAGQFGTKAGTINATITQTINYN